MIRNYLLRHAQTALYAAGQLARNPLASLMTISVIGITLALPTGLYTVLDNLQRLSGGWSGSAQISLFLKKNVSNEQIQLLTEKLRRRQEIETVHYISPEEALAEFRKHSGFGEALDALPGNPLPGVLIVDPGQSAAAPEAVQALRDELAREAPVDLAQLDLAWVKRLHRMLALARRGVVLLGGLLALAVLLTIGNTIRLAILNRRDEIEIIKLIGGTSAFVRRPFLYSGSLQGLAGAWVGALLVNGGIWSLQGPVSELALLYGSGFRMSALDAQGFGLLTLSGALLGWVGSRLAVGRHLKEIEPR